MIRRLRIYLWRVVTPEKISKCPKIQSAFALELSLLCDPEWLNPCLLQSLNNGKVELRHTRAAVVGQLINESIQGTLLDNCFDCQ